MTPQQNEIIWLIMRRMRTPLIALILVLSLSVLGMVLVPGVDASGHLVSMSFLDAIYFVAFMSTTIGFGEIPYEFTPEQRLLVLSMIFLNVTIWIYAIGSILSLVQDSRFKLALTRFRFARKVSHLREPFYIICGCGDTGLRVLEGLTERDMPCVVVEIDQSKIDRLSLGRLTGNIPSVMADAQDPETLMLCGLHHPFCRGVAALTNNDDSNLAIAMSCKLLRDDMMILCRSETDRISQNMASFHTDVIIDPYKRFARRLALALTRPHALQVQEWLTSLPGARLKDITSPPHGLWVICGMGRLGTALLSELKECDIDIAVIDPDTKRLPLGFRSAIGNGTGATTLETAGIHEAVGIVAGTNNDIDNLSILVTARHLNPGLHAVVRQNLSQYEPLFDRCDADMVASRHRIIAREILTELTNPLIRPFLVFAAKRSEQWNALLQKRLKLILGQYAPDLWSIKIDAYATKPVQYCLANEQKVHLRDLLKDPRVITESISCIPLVLVRNGERRMLPENDQKVKPGDEILFCGTHKAHRLLLWNLRDPHVLYYNVTGSDLPRGNVMKWVNS
ncbi:MAG: potassium channel family protein [bacterium]